MSIPPDSGTVAQTRIKATIKRGSARARDRASRINDEAIRDLREIYQRAANDIEAQIQSYGPGENLRLDVLGEIRAQIDERLAALSRRQQQDLESAMERSAMQGAMPFDGIAGRPAARLSTEAIEFVRAFQAADGLQLSDRLWRLDEGAREAVGAAVSDAITQGHSASRAVNRFLEEGAPVPASLERKRNNANAARVGRLAADALMTGDMSPRAQALRVFRTEINRAHGEAYMLSAEESVDVGGFKFLLSPAHPEIDICDMHASVNAFGLGPGVYPDRARVPWPAHPNTLSYIEVVFADEITKRDRTSKETRIDWLKRQSPGVVEGVVGGRKKRAALERGLLTERQIATPWRVLKERYEGQGHDTAALEPVDLAESAIWPNRIVTGKHAEAFVRGQGIKTGFEHAVAVHSVSGRAAIVKTSNAPSYVEFTPAELDTLRAGKFRLVHNHPSSYSVSPEDLIFHTAVKLHDIVATAHDGTVYRAQVRAPRQNLIGQLEQIEEYLLRVFWPMVRGGELTAEAANMLHAHVKNEILAELGTIAYEANPIGKGLRAALGAIEPQRLRDIIEGYRT